MLIPEELMLTLGMIAVVFLFAYVFTIVTLKFLDPKKREEFLRQQDDLLRTYGSEHEVRGKS